MASSSPPSRRSVCEICHLNYKKYKCPTCLVPVCSLECSRVHKSTPCTAAVPTPQPDPALQFIPISKFTDHQLHTDIQFLDGISSKLDHLQSQKNLRKRKAEEYRWSVLVDRAKQRGIEVRVMPGLARNRVNTSMFHKQNGCIRWRVEVLVPEVGWEGFVKQVDENIGLNEVVGKVIEHGRASLTDKFEGSAFQLVERDDMLQVLLKSTKNPLVLIREGNTYFQLDPELPFGPQLASRTIVEFPTLYIYSSVDKLPQGSQLVVEDETLAGDEKDLKQPFLDTSLTAEPVEKKSKIVDVDLQRLAHQLLGGQQQ